MIGVKAVLLASLIALCSLVLIDYITVRQHERLHGIIYEKQGYYNYTTDVSLLLGGSVRLNEPMKPEDQDLNDIMHNQNDSVLYNLQMYFDMIIGFIVFCVVLWAWAIVEGNNEHKKPKLQII